MNTSAPHRVLRPGDMLNWYRIERILGRGGFGIIYLATDTNLNHRVAIKEYRVLVSSDICNTDATTGDFHVRASEGVQRFLTEARNLVRFKHPNIVRVMSVFELNDTAYMVMEYEEGLNLRDYLSDRLNLEEDALKRLIVPISHGLTEVHRHGFIHRDIKPANILVRTNGSPVLLDFGSARSAGPVSAGTLTALVSSGYSPLEQYSGGSERHQGPWTDIYALGAVLYFAVSGAEPVDSARRGTALLNGGRDPLLPARLLGADRYSRSFLDAIDWALQLRIADRPASLADWMPSLLGRTLHDVHSRDIRPVHADPAQGRLLRNPRRRRELREHELKVASLSGQDDRYPLLSVIGRHRRSFAGIVMALAVLMALAWMTVKQSELSAGLQPGNVAAAGSAGGADVVVKPAESGQTQADQTQADQTQADQTQADQTRADEARADEARADEARADQARADEARAEKAGAAQAAERSAAQKATSEKEWDTVQAAARTAAAKRLAVERAEAEEKARMLSRRIQLAQTLEQASLLLDQGLLDEAEAALDDAAILDRNDVNLKALRGRWRAAFIDSRMPVSDGDFDSVLARFDRLRQALENNDPASMDELTESSSQNELFRLLMSNFARLDIRIDQIRVTNAEKSISANLRIEFMMRANGARATPSPAYRERTITSRRVEGKWSRIHW